jgi:hypothetical protein
MAEVPQAEPCKECPFRKNSLKGYTGPHKHFVEILEIVHSDQKFPCHQRVNAILKREGQTGCYDRTEAVEHASELAPFCTGAIAYMNNTIKMVREPSAVNYADKIGKRNDVFATTVEAQAYHHGVKDVRVIFAVPGQAKVSVKLVNDHLAKLKQVQALRPENKRIANKSTRKLGKQALR